MSGQTGQSHDALDALAAEYALGTLEGADFKTAERRYAADPRFRDAVHRWQERLGALAMELPAREPPAAILHGIIARMDAPSAVTASLPFWSGLLFWRCMAAAGALASAAFATALLVNAPPASTPPIAAAPGAGQAYLAPLSGKEGAPLFFIALDPAHSGLMVIPATNPQDSRGFPHLWVMRGDDDPEAIGTIDMRKPRFLRVPAGVAAKLDDNAVLVVTLDRAETTPKADAMGPVIAKGSLSPM